MTRAEAIDLCKNLKLFMEINDKLYANKFLESYHVALSMAIKALEETSELQAINLDLASENEILLDQIQEMKAKRWIPVSEKLPEQVKCDDGYIEPSKEVLVQASSGAFYISRYWKHKTHLDYEAWIDLNHYSDIIAWMPLPEPYREVSE